MCTAAAMGTAKKSLEERIKGGTDVLLEIDSPGALQVKKRILMPC